MRNTLLLLVCAITLVAANVHRSTGEVRHVETDLYEYDASGVTGTVLISPLPNGAGVLQVRGPRPPAGPEVQGVLLEEFGLQ